MEAVLVSSDLCKLPSLQYYVHGDVRSLLTMFLLFSVQVLPDCETMGQEKLLEAMTDPWHSSQENIRAG